jgi:hypothetical protein
MQWLVDERMGLMNVGVLLHVQKCLIERDAAVYCIKMLYRTVPSGIIHQ